MDKELNVFDYMCNRNNFFANQFNIVLKILVRMNV